LLPDQAPEAAHEVALTEDHVSVDAAPEVTVLGAALKVTTGANVPTVTVAVCVAEPPAPVQVSSYSVVLDSAPVDAVPLVALVPCHPPDAVHEVAFAELQLRLAVPPLATVVGDAVNFTVGAPPMTATSTDFALDPPLPVQVSV
jgi:hypothetical protein